MLLSSDIRKMTKKMDSHSDTRCILYNKELKLYNICITEMQISSYKM